MIRQTRWSPNWSSLVPIREVGSKPPLFFVHAPRGYVFLYYHLASHLDPDLPIYGLQSVGLSRGQTPHFSLQEMAAHYIKEIRSLQPQGPYSLCGFCLGGVLAFEMARQLDVEGCRVGLVALIDSYPPMQSTGTRHARSEKRRSEIRKSAARHIGRFLRRGAKSKFVYLWRRLQHLVLMARYLFWLCGHNYYARRNRPLPRWFHDVYMINVQALFAYKPRDYSGKVTLLTTRAAIDEMSVAPEEVWKEYARGQIEPYTFSCDHENLMNDPNASEVAAILQNCLDLAVTAEGRRESGEGP